MLYNLVPLKTEHQLVKLRVPEQGFFPEVPFQGCGGECPVLQEEQGPVIACCSLGPIVFLRPSVVPELMDAFTYFLELSLCQALC